MINLVIVEDSYDTREGFKYLLKLQSDIRVLKACESAEELLEQEHILEYTNVILMDIELPGMNGIKATGYLLKSIFSIFIESWMYVPRWNLSKKLLMKTSWIISKTLLKR